MWKATEMGIRIRMKIRRNTKIQRVEKREIAGARVSASLSAESHGNIKQTETTVGNRLKIASDNKRALR